MRRFVARRPSPAMAVALLALFVALGSGAYAASSLPRDSVGTAQLKEGAVTAAKLHKNAVTSVKVKDHSLLAKDFKAGQLPAGPQGRQGAPGPVTGPAGGDLTGSYPDPTIGAGAVSTSKLGTIPAASVSCSFSRVPGRPGCNSIASGGATSIHFPTYNFDNDKLHSTNSDLLTAPVAGIYRAEGYVGFPAIGTGLRFVGIGTPYSCCFGAEQLGSGSVSGSDPTMLSTSALVQLTAGDSLTLQVAQTSGGTMTLSDAGFSMSWVGLP
jgi:hypothetical protein